MSILAAPPHEKAKAAWNYIFFRHGHSPEWFRSTLDVWIDGCRRAGGEALQVALLMRFRVQSLEWQSQDVRSRWY